MSAEFAGRLRALPDGDAPSEPAPEPTPEPEALHEAPAEAALQLLGALQRKGRFIDFLWEDVSSFSDAEVGAAARVVHDGAKEAIDELFDVAPIRAEEEGTRIRLEADHDAASVRVVGDVRGEPPFEGELTHAGWQVLETHLPKLADDHRPEILAPAEVEL